MMENKFFDFEDDIEVEIEEPKPFKKSKKVEKTKIKTIGLFDHLKAITEFEYDPDYFDNLSERGKKTFLVYMINRFLSMNQNWLSTVNYFQQYTQFVSAKEVYKFYASIIPKDRIFLRYVKETGTKYNKDLVLLVSHYHKVSTKEATDYLNVLYVIPNGMEIVKELCAMYGHDEKEVKKLIKV